MSKRNLYVGTYTRPAPYLAATNGEGLYVMEFDAESGALAMKQEVPGIENPSYLTVAPDGKSLHAIWEVLDWPEGLVSSYAIDDNGELEFKGLQGSKGTVTCYATMDTQSRFCFVANYWSGTVAMFPVREDGSLGEATDVVQQEGTGPDVDRQEASHAHCFVVSPDDRFVFSADLGADKIFGYEIDYEGGRLIPRSAVDIPPGSGPRHFVFHPDASSAYVIYELQSKIGALSYDAASGTLEFLEDYSTLPSDFTEHSHCADLHVHPSGKWVYGSNRGHDSVAVFAVGDGGRLTPVGHRSTEGTTPRNFAISPDGAFLLAANQDSDNVVVMRIDQETGMPSDTVHTAEVPTPVCLKFS